MLLILMAIILFTRAIYSISTDNSTFIQANQTQQQNNSNKTTQYTVMPKLSRSVKDKFLVVQMQQPLPKRCNPDGTRTVTKKVCHKDKCKILYFKIKVKKCQGISLWDSLSVNSFSHYFDTGINFGYYFTPAMFYRIMQFVDPLIGTYMTTYKNSNIWKEHWLLG